MATTTCSGLSQRTNAYVEMLAHEPIMCLSKFGMTKPMPKNKANVIKFRRPVPLDGNHSSDRGSPTCRPSRMRT